ncbi:MAG: toll/interleukin-1 receptor domain-containing protein, partial [Tannerella sp.]|nr:toll/interleukin-1 receptor domain-containing protein [Tannerella sp.]
MGSVEKDFFISYAESDGGWATWIAQTLEENGYTVTIMDWDFRPGELFPVEMDKAIRNCERFIAVLSKAYHKSYFSTEEWANFFAKKGYGNIISVRVENYKPEGLWKARLYIDFVHKNKQEAKEALLKGVSKKGVPRIGAAFPGHGSSSFATNNSGVRAPYPGLFTYGMPNRNPHFTGREEILTAIHRTFERREAIAMTQSLTGLGGVGKSQIAIEYAYRYSQEYMQIVWVNAENDGTLYASMEAFAMEMDLVKKDDRY